MNTRSFTAIALVALSLGACSSPTPEPKGDHFITATTNYFSEEKGVELRVTHIGVNLENSTKFASFHNALKQSERDIAGSGYKSFETKGHIRNGPLSTKPHLACTVTMKGDSLQSFTCAPVTKQRGLKSALDAIS